MLVLESLVLRRVSDLIIRLVYRVSSSASLGIGPHLSFLEGVDLHEGAFFCFTSFIFFSIDLLVVKRDCHEIIVSRENDVQDGSLDALVLDAADLSDLGLFNF